MNRIIIIGNGFDRAHNLRTGYKEFIDNYWSDFINKITDKVRNQSKPYYKLKTFKDEYVSLEDNYPNQITLKIPETAFERPKSYKELTKFINEYNE